MLANAFPLPFKSRKLKIKLNGNTSISQNSHLLQKKVLRSREVEIFCKTAMETVFAHLQSTDLESVVCLNRLQDFFNS